MRFSDFFKLSKDQFELDFVDVPLDGDIPLFIDPYALSKRSDQLSAICSNIIISFFQGVIDDIKNKNYSTARYNLGSLSEPNETHLGLSSHKPQGKGVSGKQSTDIFDRLKTSRATLTGFLRDLSDCELLIPGISRDKISDIVTNIIKIELLKYTEQQCVTYNIPTLRVSSGRFWNPVDTKWDSRYANLPVYKSKRIILVPKAIVRCSLEYNHKNYYSRFVLEYLQEEHLNANTSLVRLLKNGNRAVYKKDLKDDPRYTLTKQYLYEFSEAHPEVLKKYTDSLSEEIPPLTDEEIEVKQTVPRTFDIDTLSKRLRNTPFGTETAPDYHNLIIGILEAIFYPDLYSPNKEEKIHDGRKRIDITYQNAARGGFFEFLANNKFPCPFIICECKNYSEDPENPELDQLSGRFSPRRGQFGMLVCRKVENRVLMTQRCRDTANDGRGYILVLDDEDLYHLLEYKKTGNKPGIDELLTERFKRLIM